MCTKLTFEVTDILTITANAQNRIDSVSSFFFRDVIPRFGKNEALTSEKVFEQL